MPVLLDTNILLRLSQPDHPHAAVAKRAIAYLADIDESLHITVQNIVEYWAVATRPVMNNGLSLSIERVIGDLEVARKTAVLLPELPLQSTWEHLVKAYRISGKNSHDAWLVAAMMVHGVSSILTFDADFVGYLFLTVLDPRAIA